MRIQPGIGALAAVLLCSAGLTGCRELDQLAVRIGLVEGIPERKPKVASKSRTVVKRIAEPKVVQAGARIRAFCGDRHVRFQAGKLNESEQEKLRNDVLCSQAY